MAANCAHCSKTLRPFPVSGGPWSGTLGQLNSMPKIEADNGFVCEGCGKTICPVCAGKRASELGVREFVCTECGHRPLKKIYRI
jgi:DNA-directed RNA polymerase subunit RPC12/RpoP